MSDKKVTKLPVLHRTNDMAIELVHFDPAKPCNHNRVTYRIREGEAEVECGGCGVRLDPMFVLRQFALQDSIWRQRKEGAERIAKEYEERTRCKCQHCGKMTRIRGM